VTRLLRRAAEERPDVLVPVADALAARLGDHEFEVARNAVEALAVIDRRASIDLAAHRSELRRLLGHQKASQETRTNIVDLLSRSGSDVAVELDGE
jgi:hypothetical protein